MGRQLSLEMALAILADNGVEHDRESLACFAERRGWAVTTEVTGRPITRRRWRAAVFVTHLTVTSNYPMLSGATGHGATEEDSLAVAVASMLRRG